LVWDACKCCSAKPFLAAATWVYCIIYTIYHPMYRLDALSDTILARISLCVLWDAICLKTLIAAAVGWHNLINLL
jgi:hypothetical protein